MNDICKGKIRERLIDSLKKEGLLVNAAAILLKVTPNSISCVKNPALWYNCGEEKWKVLQRWCNSGKGIVAYSNAGGVVASQNVASEQKIQDNAVTIAETPSSLRMLMSAETPSWTSLRRLMLSDVKSDIEEVKSVPVVEESVPEPQKFHLRASDIKLVALLQEHRLLLIKEMHATEELLKLYTE